MLDIKYIKENKELVKKGIADRGMSTLVDIDVLLEVNDKRLSTLKEVEDLRKSRNDITDSIKKATNEDRPSLIKKATEIKGILQPKEENLKEIEKEYNNLMQWVPNLPHESVLVGKEENENIEIKAWLPKEGYIDVNELGVGNKSIPFMPKNSLITDAEFKLKHHLDLGEALDIIDIKQSAKVSGSRFCYLKGDLVLMQYALFELLKNKLVKEKFMPMSVPILVKDRALFGTSHLPEQADQIYKIESDYIEDKNQLNLVGSSEPSLFGYYMDKNLDLSEPKLKFAYSPCFRTEVGSWGRDVKGIKRVHQFDKLELNIVCKKEDEFKMYDKLLELNEWLYQELKIPYRVWEKCTADMGYAASKKQYDVEAWSIAQQTYVEVSSGTTAGDYQARRLNITYKDKEGNKQYATTLNGTGMPMGRLLLIILENFQLPDGSIKIPDVLVDYMNKEVIKKAE